MREARFNVGKLMCAECSLALRRFIGGMDGVESIDADQGAIAIKFNEQEIDEEQLSKITRESIEKLGYRLEE